MPIDPNDPAQRTAADVCTRWKADHVLTDQQPFTAGTGGDCDPGTLSAAGKADTLKRINGFRWLVGLGPTTESATLDATDQHCANLESWWDFTSPSSPHSPPTSAKCYTADGASGAGMSNIAWGNGPADSIDQFIQDMGNATTMGHRRWIVNPPLGPVGIGYWEGGGMYNSAECLAIFGSSGGGPNPPWVAVPNPGYVPMPIPTWEWTFHSALAGTANATITVAGERQREPPGHAHDAGAGLRSGCDLVGADGLGTRGERDLQGHDRPHRRRRQLRGPPDHVQLGLPRIRAGRRSTTSLQAASR